MNGIFDQIEQHHLELLRSLSQSLADKTTETDLLGHLLRELIKLTGAEVGAFFSWDQETQSATLQSVLQSHSNSAAEPSFSQSVLNQVAETGTAVLSFDTNSDDRYSKQRSVILNNIQAILAFPLLNRQSIYGILYLDSRVQRGQFTEASRQFLTLFSPIASLALEQILDRVKIENENRLLRAERDENPIVPGMIGSSPAMKKMQKMIVKVARTEASVLITGENGTGKDLVARAIHQLSLRADMPYFAQYIGSIPPTILDSELFGHMKGTFTGALQDRPGLFEAMDGGTLFLDEIGDLSPELQTKLLRVLQNKEIKRLGENTIRKVDVRILAATNHDLTELIRDGKFRQDLYYRLNVVKIQVPPLRERAEDIPALVNHFLKDEPVSAISRQALRRLMQYSWPGNVRELENILKRAVIMAANQQIELDDLSFENVLQNPAASLAEATLEEIKQYFIRERLDRFNGNKSQTARSLDISLRSLQQKCSEEGWT